MTMWRFAGGGAAPSPRAPLPPFYFRATPRGLWQNASVWYGPPSVSSVCDQTCRQNSSACFAAMLWQNHKGGWYGPPTATSSITVPLLPLYAVTTPQRWMIRPTYIANECIMTMWRFAGGGAAPSPAPPSRLFILEPPPRGLWQNASVWYGPPSVSSVCDQTCRQNSSACFAAMLWQNHKGGWYGPPTATSSITVPLLPLYAVTTPQRCMIRPTYIANECIMTMWRFAGGGAAPSPRAPLPPFYFRATPRGLWQNASVWYGPPSVSSVCDQTCRQNSSACFATMLWQNHKGGWYGPPTATSSITVPLLPLYAVTTPQRWMIRPTYIANECIMTMWRYLSIYLILSYLL